MKRMTTLIALAVTLASVGLIGQNPQQLFRAAVNLETVDRDLEGAIELYKKVAEGPDRALAATALLRLAGAYENLGEAQARDTYQRIVDEFSDQRTQVVEAKARLEALTPAVAAGRDGEAIDGRVVLPSPDGLIYLGGGTDYRISSDGRWGLFTSYGHQQDVGLFEYATRKVIWVTDSPVFDKAQPDSLVMSPDGSRVAYSVASRVAQTNEIHVATLSEAGDVLERTVVHQAPAKLEFGRGAVVTWLQGWTPDDELILNTRRDDDWWEVSRLDVATGQLTQLRTFPPGELARGGGSVSPDGRFFILRLTRGESVDVMTLATDDSKMSRIITLPGDTPVDWARDGSHLLYVSGQYGQPELWAVPVDAGERAGEAFPVQRDYPFSAPPQWAGDRASHKVGFRRDAAVATMDLDEAGVLRRVASPTDRLERRPMWSRSGDLAFTVTESRRLVLRRPDGTTRERVAPPAISGDDGAQMGLVGFNLEGTAVVAYHNNRHEQLGLYDLEADSWSLVDVPAVPAGWRKRLGYAVVQGDSEDHVVYYPVTKLDPATQDMGPFEIHRLDASGRNTTVYSSPDTLGAGARPLWLSADGTALRFVEGTAYREFNLETGTVRDLISTIDDTDSLGPKSSADGRTVAFQVRWTPSDGLSSRGRPSFDRVFRIMDLATGSSREVTVEWSRVLNLVRDSLTSDERSANVRIEPDRYLFELSPTGNQIALQLGTIVGSHRVLVEDPLAKVLAARSGR